MYPNNLVILTWYLICANESCNGKRKQTGNCKILEKKTVFIIP